MTECKTTDKKNQGQILVDLGIGKEVEAKFDGDGICADGGLLLLRKADEKLELSELATFCISDNRRIDLVKHQLIDLLRQRIYAIAAGYEDCNDASELRKDLMHKLAIGVLPNNEFELASQPTLSRFENGIDETALKALQQLLIHTYIRMKKKRPKVIRLRMDPTHDEVHGYQQLSFYNGFYRTYCYVPLFIFDDEGFPLTALLRPGNAGQADDGLEMVKSVVENLRRVWKNVPIELTADAAFAVPKLFDYCEENKITYFIAIKANNVLDCRSEDLVLACKKAYEEFGFETESLRIYGLADPKAKKKAWRQKEERIRFSGKKEGRMQEHFEDSLFIRKFCQFQYAAKEWGKERRIIVKCDFSSAGPERRYVITNATNNTPRHLYEEKYCKRARCENWIKELKNYLKCDRTSCQEFKANQFRLLLHTFAYILLWEVRRKANLKATTLETIRLRLIKVPVLVKETARKVWLHLASNSIWQQHFELAWQRL